MENIEEIKNILNKLKDKNEKIKYLEEQIKKIKDKKLKENAKNILKDLKSKKTLDEKLESKEETMPKETAKPIEENVSEIFKELKYQRKANPEPMQPTAPVQQKTPKPYSANSSYAPSPDYKSNIPASLYEGTAGKMFREIEDTFIKEGILTPNKSPTTDQIETLRDRLRSINPSWTEESILSYEKKIISDLKERKDVYVQRMR